MREPSKIPAHFWQSEAGRQITNLGAEAVNIAFYLMTARRANRLGLYALPVSVICKDTGMTRTVVLKTLRQITSTRFATYDFLTQWVWVKQMASWQIASGLSPTDRRVTGINRQYAALPDNPFLGKFFKRYAAPFHLTDRRDYNPIAADSQRGDEG